MYHVYILKSLKDNGYYFGHTSHLTLRIKEHNSGKVRSTKSRSPFILYYSEEFSSKSDAYKRELFFKSFEGRRWLYENKIF